MVLKNGSQKIRKTQEKSGKNQLCIFEACGAISGANFRVELCTTSNVNYTSKVTIFHLYILLVKLFEDYEQ